MELFETSGTKRVTISEIAHKAGVSQVTIYNHFQSKELLIRDMMKNLILQSVEKFEEIVRNSESFTEKIQKILFMETEVNRKGHWELIKTAAENDPEVRRFVDSTFGVQMKQQLLALVHEGQRQECINPELSSESILMHIDIFQSYFFDHDDFLTDPRNNSRLVDNRFSLFWHGLDGKRVNR